MIMKIVLILNLLDHEAFVSDKSFVSFYNYFEQL